MYVEMYMFLNFMYIVMYLFLYFMYIRMHLFKYPQEELAGKDFG